MKPALKTFGISPINMKFVVHVNEAEFRQYLGKSIDNLGGINEEVAGEGFYYHEKKYRGVIAGDFFEAKSKHEVGVLRTYQPGIIHGSFHSLGSNVKLVITTKNTGDLQAARVTFLMFPLLIFVVTLGKGDFSTLEPYLILLGTLLTAVLFHLLSRWFQFSSIRNFLEVLKGKGASFTEDRFD